MLLLGVGDMDPSLDMEPFDIELLDAECDFFDFLMLLCVEEPVVDEPFMPFGSDMLLMLSEPMLLEGIDDEPIGLEAPEPIEPAD